MALLETRDMTIRFGGLVAVNTLNLKVEPGELFGLIGPNGAGKTTIFNLITGVYAPTSGDIVFDGQPIQGKKPHQIAALGIARTFQNIRLFGDLTVLENVMVSRHMRRKQNVLSAVFRSPLYVEEEAEFREEARKLLALFQLDKLAEENGHLTFPSGATLASGARLPPGGSTWAPASAAASPASMRVPGRLRRDRRLRKEALPSRPWGR